MNSQGTLISLFLTHLLASCFFVAKPPRELVMEAPEPVTMQEITSTMITPDQAIHSSQQAALMLLRACIKRATRLAIPLKKLIPYASTPPAPTSLAFKLAHLTPAHCTGPAYEETAALIETAINRKPERIGLILPLSSTHSAIAQAVLLGAKAAASHKAIPFTSAFVVKDSRGTRAGALAALADLVFNDDAALIIAGLNTEEAQAISPLASGLVAPLLIINKDSELVRGEPYAFQVYPSERDLARTLARAAADRKFQRIAILKPQSGKADYMIAQFTAALTSLGLQVSEEVPYKDADYTSMNAAVATIAHTGDPSRRGEYLALLKAAQIKANAAQLAFDPRQAVLPPRLATDAVFIPDHYRNVHFFVKLFKYQGVQQLPLIGNHNWRSEELLRPWEPFLEGSFFADFIGKYSELPSKLSLPPRQSDYFVNANQVSHVDFQLIGYRSSTLALALTTAPYAKRKHLAQQMNLSEEKEGFFRLPLTFAEDRTVHWPTFVFGIGKKQVELLGRYESGSPTQGAATIRINP